MSISRARRLGSRRYREAKELAVHPSVRMSNDEHDCSPIKQSRGGDFRLLQITFHSCAGYPCRTCLIVDRPIGVRGPRELMRPTK
jgi:hypothetical protein